MFRYIFTFIIIICAAVFDKLYKKIPNALILAGIIGGILFNFIIYPITLKEHIIRVVFLLIIFIFGMLRWLGGGDIKLWMTLDILIGAVFSSMSVAIASVLLIISALLLNFKENAPAVFISVNQIMMDRKLDTEIKTEKGYPLALFMAFPVGIICIYQMIGAFI